MAHRVNRDAVKLGRGNTSHLSVADTVKDNRVVTERGTTLHGNYTLEDIELALRVLIQNGGTYSTACAQLEDVYNLPIHPQTLKKWCLVQFPDRYSELQSLMRDEVSKKIAGKLSEVGYQSTEVQSEILSRLADNVNNLKPNELSVAAKNVGVAGSNALEKAALLRGQPTQRIENVDTAELLKVLRKYEVIPGEATEVDD